MAFHAAKKRLRSLDSAPLAHPSIRLASGKPTCMRGPQPVKPALITSALVNVSSHLFTFTHELRASLPFQDQASADDYAPRGSPAAPDLVQADMDIPVNQVNEDLEDVLLNQPHSGKV